MGQTKTTRSISATGLFLLIMMTVGLYSCTRTQKDIIPSADYAPYVNAYTGGVISQNSTIRIELTHDQPMVDMNNELKNNPFSFSPSLKGKAYWVSNNTIEFVPEEGALKPGTLYEGTFRLGDFIEVDKKLKEFNFSFRVQERNFTLQLESLPITATQPNEINIKGEIRFSDVVKKEEVEKMLTASDGKKSYPVEVTATDNHTRYLFSIRQIPREADDYPLTITANGNAAGIDRKQSEEILIPAKDCFRFMSAERIDQPENGIEIVFSAPLSTTQDLKGLIEIPEISSSIFQISENRVFIYFEANTQNKLTLNIHEGVKDSQGKALGTSHTISFSEVSLKPQVEMSTTAAILPDSKSLIIPFRAVNLYAVDLSVIRIFENNVLMFMQTNSLASANELRRSGRLVYKKTLWLAKDASKDIHHWGDYSIDLAGLIHQEPGAIYRVILSFRQEYSAYPCGGVENQDMKFADSSTSDGLTKVSGSVLSEEDEAIWNTYKGDHPECLEKIGAFCERHGIALKLIVYLRRQDQYLESYWKQQIRRKGVTWKWVRMVKQTPRYIVLDYYHHLQVLAGFAGKENIIVQPYYEGNFDLCSDFLRVLGITDTDAFEPLESKVNLSLNNNYAEIKRILNGLLSDEPSRWNREQCWLEKLVVDCSRTEKKQYESSMFSVEERQKFMERFGEINQRIAREYMGQETLFDARPEKELPEWKKDNDLQYEDTILFFGKALFDLKREQDLQRRRLQELEGKKNILRRIVNKCRMLL